MTNNSKDLQAFKQGYIDLIQDGDLGIGVTEATIIVDLAYTEVQRVQERIIEQSRLLPLEQRAIFTSVTLNMLEGMVETSQRVLDDDVESLEAFIKQTLGGLGLGPDGEEDDPIDAALKAIGVHPDPATHGVIMHAPMDPGCACGTCARMAKLAKTEGVSIYPVHVFGRDFNAYVMPLAMVVAARMEAEGITVQ